MYSYNNKYRNSQIKRVFRTFLLLGIVTVLIFGVIKVTLAFPSVYGTSHIEQLDFINRPNLPWPSYGQSAVGVKGYGVVSASPNQQTRPIASVTKLVTALAVLEKKPLELGEQGERIIFTKEDEQIYIDYRNIQGVAVDVRAGTDLSQYKAMQYMLILSANNIADKLAIWAFGSVDEYTTYANSMLAQKGFTTLHIDDASGFSPQTVGTAEDLIILGELALNNPVIADIVSQDYIDLPDGTQKINTNPFLNYQNNGVIGIKNGLTDEAGGVLLAAAKRQIDNSEIIIITAVMGSQYFFQSQKDAIELVEPALQALLSEPAVIKKGTKVGYYSLPWGGTVDVVTSSDISLSNWSDAVSRAYINLYPIIEPKYIGETVGFIEIALDNGDKTSSEVELAGEISQPSVKWLIKNPIR